jgi:hypothetical protein
MSVVACVKVHDGIILGAESMTQIWGTDGKGNTGVTKTYENAQKLYQMANLPIGIMTYGSGNIGPRSIGSFIAEFSNANANSQNICGQAGVEVGKVADALWTFMTKIYTEAYKEMPEPKPLIGIYIGGYSAGCPLAEEWEFSLPQGKPQLVRPLETFGASWRGISVPFTRLYTGIDPRLTEELLKAGLAPNVLTPLLEKYRAPFIFDGMPVQDAIDFVTFILQTTIGMAEFEAGPPSCGGPIWIAVNSPTGFEWVKRPTWSIRRD